MCKPDEAAFFVPYPGTPESPVKRRSDWSLQNPRLLPVSSPVFLFLHHDIYGKAQTEYYEKQFTNTLVSVVIPFVDSDGNGYTLTIPKMEVTMTLPEGGGDDILQATVDYRVVEDAPTLTRSPAPIIP